MAMTIGNGSITGLNPGGLPDASVVQSDLATQVSTTGPAFSATIPANQTITGSTLTKVALTSEAFDTNNNFDSTTNYRFTPTVPGYYQINAAVGFGSGTGCNAIVAAVVKNGVTASPVAHAVTQAGATITPTTNIVTSNLIYMNGSTDYLELYGQVNAGGTVQFSSASWTTFMSGFLARAA